MKKNKWLVTLMAAAMLGITGFQLYWLRQNYVREKKSLELKTNTAFHETVMQLQASKLKLDGIKWNGETDNPSVKIIMAEANDSLKVSVKPRQEIISTVNIIQNKIKDSLKKSGKKGMIISMNETRIGVHDDTGRIDKKQPGYDKDYIFNLLFGIDSLQEKMKVTEIDSAFAKKLQKEKINIPFSILQIDSCDEKTEQPPNQVTLGLANPVTYELKLSNTFSYLLRQIGLPILFSVLLLGITTLSFVLLWRNILKQQRLASQKNEFISNITHELKTPLATVGVAIEALKNFNAMDSPQRTREYLDISANELQRLSLLVDKVLKLSMFEKKEIELKYEEINLSNLVQEVASSMKLQSEKYHANISITQKGDVCLQGDRLHLLSVIFNLLDNALKYRNENPEIKIDITGNDNTVVLKVADNGIGIAPEYKSKVFEKFFRVPHGDIHNARGYGLGLSYVAQVIKKHNGVIELESRQGQGSVFIITLPKTITT